MARKHIKEGNRSIFFYYYAIGCKRQELTIDKAIAEARELNKKIKFSDNELEKAITAAYKIQNVNISKKTILADLSIPDNDKQNCILGKRSRTTKKKKNFVKMVLLKNYDRYKHDSDRTLESTFNISKSAINKIKAEIRINLFHKDQIYNVIKSKVTLVVEEMNSCIVDNIQNTSLFTKKRL